MEQKKKFAPQIGIWPPKNPGGKSMGSVFIDKQLLETLGKAEEGGRLVLTEVPEEVREDNPKAPRYRITFFSAEESQQDRPQTKRSYSKAPAADDGI